MVECNRLTNGDISSKLVVLQFSLLSNFQQPRFSFLHSYRKCVCECVCNFSFWHVYHPLCPVSLFQCVSTSNISREVNPDSVMPKAHKQYTLPSCAQLVRMTHFNIEPRHLTVITWNWTHTHQKKELLVQIIFFFFPNELKGIRSMQNANKKKNLNNIEMKKEKKQIANGKVRNRSFHSFKLFKSRGVNDPV